MTGKAADIRVKGMAPAEVAAVIERLIERARWSRAASVCMTRTASPTTIAVAHGLDGRGRLWLLKKEPQ